eukprot:gene8902-850_t
MSNINKSIEAEVETLLEKIKIEYAEILKKKEELNEIISEAKKEKKKNIHNKIKLNIGGRVFTTSLETLTHEKETYFSGMFSEQFDLGPDKDGEYFIDRNPMYFDIILDYLRAPEKEIYFGGLSEQQIKEFKTEVDFYCINSLKEILENPKFEVFSIGNLLNCKRLSESKFRITKFDSSNWNANVTFLPAKKWKITVVSGFDLAMIGFVDKKYIDPNGKNITKGYFAYTNSGVKCSTMNLNANYGRGFRNAVVSLENGELSYILNGISYGKAFTGLSENLLPSIDIFSSRCVIDVEFIE